MIFIVEASAPWGYDYKYASFGIYLSDGFPALKHYSLIIFCRLLRRQLAGEIRPLFGSTAGAITGVFPIVKMPVLFAPVRPAGGMDMGIHIALQIDCAGILPPGASQVDGSLRAVTEQPTAVENIAKLPLPGGGGGGEIAGDPLAVGAFWGKLLGLSGKNLTLLKVTDAAPKDKVHVSLDIAVPIILPAHGAGLILTAGPVKPPGCASFRGKGAVNSVSWLPIRRQ